MGLYKVGKDFKAIFEEVAKNRIEHIGRDKYDKDYSAEVDKELDDLVRYNNLSMIINPLYKILSQISHDPFEILPNGRSIYSIVMYLAGLTEYDRVADNKINTQFYKAWAFKHISRSGNSTSRLGLEFQVTGSFLQKLEAAVGKFLQGCKDKDILRMLGNQSVKPRSDGEYWLSEDVLFREDKELDFLKQLQEESGLSVSGFGLPDNYDLIIPSGFEIPREEKGRPVKSMFREDAYEMIKSLYPIVQDEDIFNLVEHFRLRKKPDKGFLRRLKIAGIEEDFLEELKEIKYFPSRLNLVGRFTLSWRLDQYRKNVPDIYYKNKRIMYRERE